MKAKDFDKKFDDGESIANDLGLSKAQIGDVLCKHHSTK